MSRVRKKNIGELQKYTRQSAYLRQGLSNLWRDYPMIRITIRTVLLQKLRPTPPYRYSLHKSLQFHCPEGSPPLPESITLFHLQRFELVYFAQKQMNEQTASIASPIYCWNGHFSTLVIFDHDQYKSNGDVFKDVAIDSTSNHIYLFQ